MSPALPWPADLYLEGGDQYRGWFHSSLLSPLARAGTRLTGRWPPMAGRSTRRAGRRPSRWATALIPWRSPDAGRGDHSVVGGVGRFPGRCHRLRRPDEAGGGKLPQDPQYFQISTQQLADFDPAQQPSSSTTCRRSTNTGFCARPNCDRVRGYYESFEFHRIYHLVNEFAVDLSTGFIDVVKDRLYTSAPNSQGRRSAQTATWRIAGGVGPSGGAHHEFHRRRNLVISPPVAGRQESVHLAHFPKAEESPGL